MAEPIHEHGGEVLKFMGDGMLAIFNLSERRKTDACNAAYKAAVAAVDNMAEFNARRVAIGDAPVGFGLALHVGEVSLTAVARGVDAELHGRQVHADARDQHPPVVEDHDSGDRDPPQEEREDGAGSPA